MIEKSLITVPYPKEYIDSSKKLLESTIGIFGMSPLSYHLANVVCEKYPWAAQLAAREAEATDSELDDIMIANLSYDLLWGTMGCSTIVKKTPDGPYVARNMDWYPADLIANASAILPTKNGVSAATPGLFGVVTGLSNNGFAIILNAAFAVKNNYENIPMLLFLREVLDECQDFDDALNKIIKTPTMSGGLITLVGKTNDQVCVIEKTPNNYSVRSSPGNEPLVVTNHYRKKYLPDGNCERYNYLIENQEKDSVQLLEDVAQSITSQHIFIKPALNSFKLFVPENIQQEEMNFSSVLDTLNSLL